MAIVIAVIFPEPDDQNDVYDVILGLALSILIFVGVQSIIMAYKRLARPGVSLEMRKLFLLKHALYVIVLIIIWILCLMYNYNHLFNPYRINDSLE